jgi:AcrR family transcriptional regulator
MSTGLKQQPEAALGSVSKLPQQGRSRASFERMLATARELMLERGNEEFTLQEVSKRGNVSIGSIYLRFESKDNLVRAVIGQALEDISAAEDAMEAALLARCASLDAMVPSYVEAFAELLSTHAPLLRLAMERAAYDPLVSGPGKASAGKSEAIGMNCMMRFPAIAGTDPETKARSAYHVIFATLARQLSLGSTKDSAHDFNWDQLKRELGRMCLAYLKQSD